MINYELQLALIDENPFYIKNIKNPTESMCFCAVISNGFTIHYMKNPSVEIQLEAVKTNGYAIKFIDNPNRKLQWAAIENNVDVITLIKNPTKKMLLYAIEVNCELFWEIGNFDSKFIIEAIKANAYVLQYVENPTEKMQLIAVKKDPTSIQYIENPTPKVQLAAFTGAKESWYELDILEMIEDVCEELQLLIITEVDFWGGWADCIKRPCDQLLLKLIESDDWIDWVARVENLSEELQLKLIQYEPEYILDIKNPLTNVIISAISQNPFLLEDSFNFTHMEGDNSFFNETVQLYIVENLPDLFCRIPNPTSKVQVAAMKKDKNNIIHIENPSKRILNMV